MGKNVRVFIYMYTNGIVCAPTYGIVEVVECEVLDKDEF